MAFALSCSCLASGVQAALCCFFLSFPLVLLCELGVTVPRIPGRRSREGPTSQGRSALAVISPWGRGLGVKDRQRRSCQGRAENRRPVTRDEQGAGSAAPAPQGPVRGKARLRGGWGRALTAPREQRLIPEDLGLPGPVPGSPLCRLKRQRSSENGTRVAFQGTSGRLGSQPQSIFLSRAGCAKLKAGG